MKEEAHLHDYCFWLLAVLVGLAIYQSFAVATPHLINPPTSGLFPGYASEDAVRLGIFLILIIRFYLSSAYFFTTAYTGRNAERYPRKSYVSDFLFSLVRCLVFLGLATNLDFHSGSRRTFLFLLATVLSYDTIWYITARRYDTRYIVKMWAVINLLTLLLSSTCYLIARTAGAGLAVQEDAAFVPIILVSIVDLAEIKSGRPMIVPWLTQLSADPFSKREENPD